MVDKLVNAQQLIPEWQWTEQGGNLLYTAEPQSLRNWHQIAVEMGEEEQIMGLKIERLFESPSEKHL